MDPNRSGQDVVRCTLCKIHLAAMYCEVCHINLCKDCVEKHLSVKSTIHRVVPFEQYLFSPKCPDHPEKQCEHYCNQCDIPLCSQCVVSKKHKNHKAVCVMESFRKQQNILRRDLNELVDSIHHMYKEAASKIQFHKADLKKNSKKLKTALNQQKEIWYREIDNIIFNIQSKFDEMDSRYLAILDKQELEINDKITNISRIVLDIKDLVDSNDINRVLMYKSKNEELRELPPEFTASLPNFKPKAIDKKHLLEQFGSVSPFSIKAKEKVYTPSDPENQSRVFLDDPKVTAEIKTIYDELYDVFLSNDNQFWTRGHNEVMKLYNLEGKLVKCVRNESGDKPLLIAVTLDGNLVYTDLSQSSINVVKDNTLQPLIKRKGWWWIPLSVCCSSSGDILAIMTKMFHNDFLGSSVFRYTDFKKKQCIASCYSGGYFKSITENRNLDICVSDNEDRAVVVVTADGKFRFRYTGIPSTAKESFVPIAIATDSQANILKADWYNHRIDILDKDGHFLRYIENCDLEYPRGLCVDSKDNIFVAEEFTCKIKRIQYYK